MYKARTQEEFLDDTMEIGIWKERMDGRRDFLRLALSTFHTVEKSEMVPAECRMKLPADEMRAILQAIIDMAWAAGFRPANQCGELGDIARLERHVDDLRQVIGLFQNAERLK